MFRELSAISVYLILAVLLSSPIQAQNDVEPDENSESDNENFEDYYEEDYDEDEVDKKLMIIDLMFDVGVPQRSFKDRLNDTGLGMDVSMIFQLGFNRPAFMGFDLYGYHMDNEKDIIIDFVNGNTVELERKLNNWITGLDLVYRYYPPINIPVIEPYFEGLLGFKWIFSTYQTTDIIDDSSIDFEFIESSLSMSYGFSVGAQLFLSNNAYLNARTSYLPGNSVSYLTRIEDADATNTNSPIDYFELKNSATDLIRFQIGFSFILP